MGWGIWLGDGNFWFWGKQNTVVIRGGCKKVVSDEKPSSQDYSKKKLNATAGILSPGVAVGLGNIPYIHVMNMYIT
jgi:hypothetical protein